VRNVRWVAAIGITAVAAGCTTTVRRVEPVPQSSWAATPAPRPAMNYAASEQVRPARPEPLTKESVLRIATTARDAQEAIYVIDQHPFAFPLDDKAIQWFEDRAAPPELIDYLRKRAQVNWDQLRAEQELARTDPYATPQQEGVEPNAQPSVEYAQPEQPGTVVVESSPTVVYDYTDPYWYDPYWGLGYGVGIGIGWTWGWGYYGWGWYDRDHHYWGNDRYLGRSYGSVYRSGNYYGGTSYGSIYRSGNFAGGTAAPHVTVNRAGGSASPAVSVGGGVSRGGNRGGSSSSHSSGGHSGGGGHGGGHR